MNEFQNWSGARGNVAAATWPPASAGRAPTVSPKNPAVALGWWLVAVEMIIAYSRIFDVMLSGYHIPAVVYGLLIVVMLVSGSLFKPFSSSIAWFALGFTIWVGVTLPFSVWRTGSLDSANRSIQCLVIFIAVSSLVTTAKDCIQMLYILGVATSLGAFLGLFFATMETGRLEMISGSFRDPNEYAMTLLMGLPLLALMVRIGKMPMRVAAVGMMALNVSIFLRTGSRGGMIAVMVTGIILFWGVSVSKKFVFTLVALVLIPLSFVILPDYLQKRYLTFFQADEGGPTSAAERERLQNVDVASTEGRMDLLVASLKMTLEHPLFGVGPGNFPVAYFDESSKQGVRSGWHVSHNTYTQLSSETGIPGAVMFIIFLFKAFRAARRVVKTGAARGHPQLAVAAYHLWLSLVAVCAAAFFLSLGYSPIFYVLAGLALAFEQVLIREENRPARMTIAGTSLTMTQPAPVNWTDPVTQTAPNRPTRPRRGRYASLTTKPTPQP